MSAATPAYLPEKHHMTNDKHGPQDIPTGERMSHIASATGEAQTLKASGQTATQKGLHYRVDAPSKPSG